MPGLSKTLNACIPWTRVLDLLGIAVPRPVLPAVVLCPLCKQEQMVVTEEYLAGGQWFACRNCRRTGDMIELFARASNLSIPGAVLKLAQQGFDCPTDSGTIRAYLTQHVRYRKRLQLLWQKAKPYVFDQSTTLRALLSKLRLPHDHTIDRWNAGPAQIVGGEQCSTIESTFLPGSMRHTQSTGVSLSTSSKRIFRGGGWRETLVLPFYASPGLLSGFGYIGRQGEMRTDYVFRCANSTILPSPHAREAGLAFHPDAREISVEWDHAIFAISDPLAYLHLNLRHFEWSNSALPLVLWQDVQVGNVHACTRRAWEMFHTCRVIFWDPSLSLSTLRQAVAIDGWIATCGPRRNGAEELRDYLCRCQPTLLCRQLQKHARPWPRALAKAMIKWTDARIEDLLLQLQLEPRQLGRIRKACPPKLRERLDTILKPHRMQRTARFENYTIVELKDGWHGQPDYAGRRSKMISICDVSLQLSQVITYRRTGQIVYAGKVTFNGEEIPFTAPQKEIEKNAGAWLRTFLNRMGKGYIRCHSKWRKKLLDVAATFHEPAAVWGLETVGWDQEQNAFLLPAWHIGLNGIRKQTLLDDAALLPAANLKYSAEPLPMNHAEQADEYAVSLFWAILGSILDNILAPALLRETKGIGLVGAGAQEMGLAVAKEAGCLTREIQSMKTVRVAAEEEQRHRWPLCAPIAKNATKTAVSQWLEGDQVYTRNCVTPLDAATAEEKGDGNRWNLVFGIKPIKMAGNLERWRLLRLVKRIIPGYLRDVCSRGLNVENVLEDLAGFIGRQGGSVPVEKVHEMLRGAGTMNSSLISC